MKTEWSEFKRLVEDAGLLPHRCGHATARWPGTHWQITGGAQLVNVWPDTKRGFRMAVDNGRGCPGTIAKAIKVAGPPKVLKPQREHKYPASVPADMPPWHECRARVPDNAPREDRPVGLIRRFWRWIW